MGKSKAQVIVHLDESMRSGLARWAAAEERSMSAQVRLVLKDAIPAEFRDGHVHDFDLDGKLRFCTCGANNPVPAATTG